MTYQHGGHVMGAAPAQQPDVPLQLLHVLYVVRVAAAVCPAGARLLCGRAVRAAGDCSVLLGVLGTRSVVCGCLLLLLAAFCWTEAAGCMLVAVAGGCSVLQRVLEALGKTCGCLLLLAASCLMEVAGCVLAGVVVALARGRVAA